MRMGIVTAVFQAPSTKVAGATAALERSASLKVEEGLATPRTSACKCKSVGLSIELRLAEGDAATWYAVGLT